MRLRYLFGLLALTPSIYANPVDSRETHLLTKRASSDDADEPVSLPTVFNGVEVPHMTELNGESIDDQIKDGYWLVEFFSPWCHHCKAFAPTWQTVYEFYYTMDPLHNMQNMKSGSKEDLSSFTGYYDFKFARVDCVAFGTACGNKEIHSFPTVVLFKDGVVQEKKVGTQELSDVSKWVEATLEAARPGSRPANGPKLPEVGASFVEDAEAPMTIKDGKAKAGKAKDKISKGKEAAKPASKAASKANKGSFNPDGASVPLTAETFQKLVTTTRDPWFIKFYAPWCHHCQAMAPNWFSMAREMKGKLNIGEVNCDAEKRLCKEAHVKGYPTVLFFRGGERVEYEGLRGVGDLISFAQKASEATGVIDVDAEAFKKMEKTEEVIFTYFYDHATTSEDFAALERVTLSLIGHAKLVKTDDPKMAERFKVSTWPRLMVSRDGKPSYYRPITPRDMRDYRKILSWMQTVWLPLVPELTSSNAHDIMSDGSIVVLAILSRDRSDEFAIARREIKNAALEWIDKDTHARQLERQELRDAKQLRIEEAEDRNDQRGLRTAKQIRIDVDAVKRPEVRFAWVDGIFWERWIRTTYGIDVRTDGERVIINDEDNHQYWDTTITGNPIVPSRTSILETLPKVLASPSKIASKSTTSRIARVYYSLKSWRSHHPVLAVFMLVGVLLSSLFSVRKWRKTGRAMAGNLISSTGWGKQGNGFFKLPMGNHGDGHGGLLGGSGGGASGGKTD